MKKVFAFLIVLMVICSASFADKKAGYKVESFVGKVSYEVSNGEWADIKQGMILDLDANVSTGLNSTLTVTLDGKEITIKPMKKGKIGELIAMSTTKSSIKIGSTITQNDIAAASKTTKAVVTASSRASEAKADVEWDE